MEVTYKLGGFKQIAVENDLQILEHDLAQIQPYPAYVEVILPPEAQAPG